MRSTGSCCGIALMLVACTAFAADWPEIPESEWKLESVPAFSEATAVVLSREGKFVMSEKSLSSFLDVYERVKVLKEEGKEYGTVSLASSDFLRMKDLEARVRLPGGRIVDLPKDAKFEKKYSLYYRQYVTSFAMPEVAVGAIIEHRYRLYFDSVLFGEPWYFQTRIPTLRSAITCTIPKSFTFKPHLVKTVDRQAQQSVDESVRGVSTSFAFTDLPPVPDEPGSPPFHDLATRVTSFPSR